MSLKNSTSKDVLNFSTQLIKQCWLELSPVLTVLLNLPIQQGVFPTEKSSIIVPIQKTKDKRDLN